MKIEGGGRFFTALSDKEHDILIERRNIQRNSELRNARIVFGINAEQWNIDILQLIDTERGLVNNMDEDMNNTS